MRDVIEQLREYSQAVADQVAPVAADDATRRRTSHPLRWVTAAAAVVVIAIAVGVVVARDEGTRQPAPTSPKPNKITTIEPIRNTEGIDLIEPPPLAPRSDVAVAFTGREIVVWGGDLEAENQGLPGPSRSYADGAAYDVTARQWRPMSTGPLPENATVPIAAATSVGVVIARERSAAIWRPDSDTWTAFDSAPGDVRDLVFDGSKALSFSARASLDLASGRWSKWPAPPAELEDPATAWTGTELVAVGRGPEGLAALAWNPTDARWTRLPAPTGLDVNAFRIAWDGTRVVGLDYAMASTTYTPGSSQWNSGPEVPARFFEHWPSLAAVDPGVVTAMPLALVVGDGNRWVPVPFPDGFSAGALVPLTTGDGVRAAQLAMIGNRRDGLLALAILDPVRLIADPRVVQVGMVAVPVPEDGTVRSVTGAGGASPTRAVTAEMPTRTGTCTVSSAYAAFTPHDLPPRWARDAPDGTEWHADVTTSDRISVRCTDAADAQWLVDRIELPSE